MNAETTTSQEEHIPQHGTTAEPTAGPAPQPERKTEEEKTYTKSASMVNSIVAEKINKISHNLWINSLGAEVKIDNDFHLNLERKTQKLNFEPYEYKGYHARLEALSVNFVNDIIDTIYDTPHPSRIVLIDDRNEDDSMAMAVIETIARRAAEALGGMIFYCMLEHEESYTIKHVIEEFARSNASGADTERVLIIHDFRESMETNNTFFKLLYKQSGVDNIASTLKNARLQLIYLNAKNNLPDAFSKKTDHCLSLCVLDSLKYFLYTLLKDYRQAERYGYKISDAMKSVGWLAELDKHGQQEEISGLITAGQIDTVLALVTSDNNIAKEKKMVSNLLTDPLKNIILFVSAFFEQVNISEFDLLIRLLIAKQYHDADDTEANQKKLGYRWETEGDRHVAECGIIVRKDTHRYSRYAFKIEAHKAYTVALFSDDYRLLLLRRHEIIDQEKFIFSNSYSPALHESIMDLCLVNTEVNERKYLVATSLTLADHISEQDLSTEQRFYAFQRMLDFLLKWINIPLYEKSFSHYQEHMHRSRSGRYILALVFAHICTPDYPDNLSWLRKYLAAIDSNGPEEFIHRTVVIFNHYKDNFMERIFLNYSDNFLDFLQETEQWKEADKQEDQRSYAYIKFSLLNLFINKRESGIKASDPAYIILKQLILKNALQNIKLLSAIIFDESAEQAYIDLFKETYEELYDNSKTLLKIINRDIYLTYAFILIEWQHVFSRIKEDQNPLLQELDVTQLVSAGIQQCTGIYQKELLNTGLSAARKYYNELYISTEKKKDKQIHKEKRDSCYALSKMINNPV